MKEVLDSTGIASRAEEIYEKHLRTQLEPTHHGWFLTIEPTSGDYFLGQTLSEAALAARYVHADRPTYTLRIGYPVVFEIGNSPQ